jgi:hypothetical protein
LMSGLVEAFSKCRTPPDFYRLQIPFENTATPTEFDELWNQRSMLPPTAQKWLLSIWRMMFYEPPRLQRFSRSQLGTHIWVYRGSQTAPAHKELVIGFAGRSGRVMLPVAVLLQYLSDARFDFVLLQDPQWTFFLDGIPGYGKNLVEVLLRLSGDLKLAQYDSIRCVGGSGGGAAALRAGVALRALRAISIGGQMPTRGAGAKRESDGELEALTKPWRGVDTNTTQLICAFGAKNEKDRSASIALAQGGPTELVPLEGISDHNALFSLLKERRLTGFMTDVILGE